MNNTDGKPMSKKQILFRISPLSPIAVVIGLFIQTCYGWKAPVTAADLAWMEFHIFIEPTMLAIIIWLLVISVPMIVVGMIGFVVMMIEFFRSPN